MTAILVADDDTDIRDLVAFKLEQAGFDVTAVDNGLAALTAARLEPPDLVVLDVMMPGMSGIDVLKRLRADTSQQSIPVILITARSHDEWVMSSCCACMKRGFVRSRRRC